MSVGQTCSYVVALECGVYKWQGKAYKLEKGCKQIYKKDKMNLSDTLEWQRTGTTSFIIFELKHLHCVTEEIMTRNFKKLQNNNVKIRMGKFYTSRLHGCRSTTWKS